MSAIDFSIAFRRRNGVWGQNIFIFSLTVLFIESMWSEAPQNYYENDLATSCYYSPLTLCCLLKVQRKSSIGIWRQYRTISCMFIQRCPPTLPALFVWTKKGSGTLSHLDSKCERERIAVKKISEHSSGEFPQEKCPVFYSHVIYKRWGLLPVSICNTVFIKTMHFHI